MVSLILTLLIVLCALWIALGALPASADGHMPLPYLIALIPLLWVPMAAVAAVALALGQYGIMCGAVAIALASQIRQLKHRNEPQPQEGHRPVADSVRQSKNYSGVDPTASLASSTSSIFPNERPDSTDRHVDGSNDSPVQSSLRLMTLNCRYGRANETAIIEAVRSRDIDVLALQELTADLVRRLDEAGIGDLLPYRQLGEERSTDNGGFNGIWTRFEPAYATSRIVDIPAADVPGITVALPPANQHAESDGLVGDTVTPTGTRTAPPDSHESQTYVTIASAHPKSPMRGCREWSAGIIGLGRLCDGSSHDQPSDVVPSHDSLSPHPSSTSGPAVTRILDTAGTINRHIAVVMGDLNSGIDHPSFRRLLAQGFSDADLNEGGPARTTFPSWLPWPRIVLDHILFTPGARAHDTASFVVAGTDHLALAAMLTIV